jgi:hypothetical protein
MPYCQNNVLQDITLPQGLYQQKGWYTVLITMKVEKQEYIPVLWNSPANFECVMLKLRKAYFAKHFENLTSDNLLLKDNVHQGQFGKSALLNEHLHDRVHCLLLWKRIIVDDPYNIY